VDGWKQGHQLVCGVERTHPLLDTLEGVNLVFGAPTRQPVCDSSGWTELPGFVGTEQNGIEFHDRELKEGLVEELRTHEEVTVDGMLFVYLVAVTNATCHEHPGLCFTRGKFADTNFAPYQDEVPVYYLSPDVDVLSQIGSNTIYGGQWVVDCGGEDKMLLGMTHEGPMVMCPRQWQDWLAVRAAQDAANEGAEGNVKLFKKAFAATLMSKQYYLWPRGRLGVVEASAT
jgi:hypothetical protein